mgnify:CR=1 FL=1
MRIVHTASTFCLSLLALAAAGAAHAQDAEVVGQVTTFIAGRSFIYHEVSAERVAPQEAIEGNIEVHHPVIDPRRHSEFWHMNARNRVLLARRNLPAVLRPLTSYLRIIGACYPAVAARSGCRG